MKAQVSLTVTESKRLIGKATVEHPWVKKALKKGIVAVATGSTNSFVAEEILGKNLEKERYVAGFVDGKGTCVVPRERRLESVILEKGKMVEEDINEIPKRMGHDDVFIKGANAIDFDGVAGVMMASLSGGTIGNVLGALKARGTKLIIPVGLEKLIPHSVGEASNIAGIYEMEYSDGIPVGLMPVYGKVITEIEAFRILADVEAITIGSGGIGGGEGSKTFVLEGPRERVSEAIEVVESLKGEEDVPALRGKCETCVFYYCPMNKKDK